MFQRLKQLFVSLVIYGLGDVATSIVSFLLLPLFTRYLSPRDYGVIALLLTIEVVTKIVYRWGIDASFMRLYYDCKSERDRQVLASTIFFFLAALNGTLLTIGLAGAPFLAQHLLGSVEYTTVLRLVLVNTFIVGFYFIPFHTLRIEGKPQRFIGLTFTRSVATVAARLYFVVVAALGVLGMVMADVLVTGLFTLLLVRSFARFIRPTFSLSILREALRFGLPRVPHGVAHQVIAIADRYILRFFGTLADVGVYSIGASFGLALKLFLSAFEYGWAPFYFDAMRRPDAKEVFRLVTTYSLLVLVLLTAGVAAISTDVVRIMTTPEFAPAAPIVPWIAVGVLFQGVYLLTSIGLNITKRTEYYPIATGIAAGTSVTANFLLVPRFGPIGAAWANALAYAVLAGVSMRFSQRFYPIEYEWTRIARIALAGLAAVLCATLLLPRDLSPWLGASARSAVVIVTYVAVLALTGFFERREMNRLRQLVPTPFRPRVDRITESPSSELGGEIVSATGPEELERADEQVERTRRMA